MLAKGGTIADPPLGADIFANDQHDAVHDGVAQEDEQEQGIRGVFHQGGLGDAPAVVDQSRREAHGARNKALELKQHGKQKKGDQGQRIGRHGLPDGAGRLAVALKIPQKSQNGGDAQGIDDDADDRQHGIGQDHQMVQQEIEQGLHQHGQDAGADQVQEIDTR